MDKYRVQLPWSAYAPISEASHSLRAGYGLGEAAEIGPPGQSQANGDANDAYGQPDMALPPMTLAPISSQRRPATMAMTATTLRTIRSMVVS